MAAPIENPISKKIAHVFPELRSMDISTPIIAAAGVLVGSAWQYLLQERSKHKDREIAERYKQLDKEQTERARQLEVYRVVYPEKVKAAQSISALAASLFELAGQLNRTHRLDDPDATRQLRADADTLHVLSISNEWLLGTYLCDLSRLLSVCIRKLVPDTPRLGGRAQWSLGENGVLESYTLAHRELKDEIRNQLHMTVLDELLPAQKVMAEGQRIMLQTEYIQKPLDKWP